MKTPPMASNDSTEGPRTPLPPVSENAKLQTDPKAPGAHSRTSSFHFGRPFMPFTTTTTTAPTTPPADGSTKIDMEHDAIDDFVPPRQAMNSDESDFDWDEDINMDDKGQVIKKNTKNSNSKWRRLSPFSRMVILIAVGSPIIALPAILVSTLMEDDDDAPEDPNMPHPAAPKATITLIFVWLSFMWGIVFLTNWGIDMVPVVVVRLTSMVSGTRMENIRSRLLIFVATKKHLKWLVASCWAIGSFAFLSKASYSKADKKLNPIFVNVLASLVAGCGLVLFEKILLHVISTNFHQTAYADRIKVNKYALTVLDMLSSSKKHVKKVRASYSRHSTSESGHGDFPFPSGYRPVQPSRSNSLEMGGMNKEKDAVGEAEVLHEISDESTQKNAEALILSSTPMTSPTELNAASNNMTSNSTSRPHHQHHRHRDSKTKQGDNIFRGFNRRLYGIALANKSSPTKDIGSTANAKRLAKTLFYNLQNSGEELLVQDFYPYFPTPEEAQAAFAIFDRDGNGDISKREMKETIFYVYKERKDLHTSLRDLSQAVGKLDVIFLAIMIVIWLLIILSIFGKDVVKNMLSIGSFLIALSFVFGNSLKILFENIVFLFITHPYDSGDLVSIGGNDMYVREVGLNSTMFVTWDGKRMYYPNSIISQLPIHNVRRSPNMTDKIVINIDCYTPQSKILELRARMRDYLMKENKEFLPDLEIQIQEMDFNYALKDAVEDLGIRYYALPQRVELYNRDGQEIDAAQGPHPHTPPSPTGRAESLMQQDIRDTLDPNSPLRHYSSDQVAHLYRRPVISKPEGE
ncbi:hypothetical protein BG011_000453 [Mortierella polycephala]|uniref:EF-hand domain-containing protein n=1 Tax=Mortierella polycephala TaxID=41804 RepID=A0A9P6TVL9_9FUNG|nr:hypothetical protein BG011_000453 [Mortierella polycephala]